MVINNQNQAIEKASNDILEIQNILKPSKPRESLKIGVYSIKIYHSILTPDFKSKTILTDSTWEYVDIFLKKNSNKSNSHKNAILYWQQARNFFNATKDLDSISKPLTTYYCFLNATKALLEIKNIKYDFSHGVSGKSLPGHNNIKNEFVRLQTKGVLAGLCEYFEETVIQKSALEKYEEYCLKDVLYNLAYVHRAYNITYANQAELFIPIKNPRFVKEKALEKAWFEFELEPEHSTKTVETRLKSSKFEQEPNVSNKKYYTMRHKRRIKWIVSRNTPDAGSLLRIQNYIKARRKELQYIYSTNELWYIKRSDLTSSSVINRNPLVLTYAAMHRLSELARYDPNILKAHLEKDASWLLTEFINKSIVQFIDQISSEITGNHFRITGFRS